MRSISLAATLIPVATLLPAAALAEVPQIVTDIAPVHSLVSQVMDGVGTPYLLIPASASPHSFSLRPSDARQLQDADLIVWIGEDLTPWLEGPLSSIASTADRLTLLDLDATLLREMTEHDGHDHGGHGDEHDDEEHEDEHGHGHDEHGHDDHGQDEHAHDEKHDHGDNHAHEDDHGHDEHDHGDEHAHENEHTDAGDHAHGDEDAHGHAHHGTDPHVWLDPVNAAAWLPVIAAQLSELDAENAATYTRNAEQAIAELLPLIEELEAQLADAPGYITSHAAFGYFEDRFGVSSLGAIADGDATAPGPARIAGLRDAATAAGVRCVLVEPQYNEGLADAVVPEDLRIGQIDPLGSAFEPGSALYAQLMRSIADAISGCADG